MVPFGVSTDHHEAQADWREEFAVLEGEGVTEMRATCRRARGAFGASWRRLDALGAALAGAAAAKAEQEQAAAAEAEQEQAAAA